MAADGGNDYVDGELASGMFARWILDNRKTAYLTYWPLVDAKDHLDGDGDDGVANVGMLESIGKRTLFKAMHNIFPIYYVFHALLSVYWLVALRRSTAHRCTSGLGCGGDYEDDARALC